MSHTEWKRAEGRQEARTSGLRWRQVETYEPNSPAGSVPVETFYQVAVEKCDHSDGLRCGYPKDAHPVVCSCWSGPLVKIGDGEYSGHNFQ